MIKKTLYFAGEAKSIAYPKLNEESHIKRVK